MLIEEYEDQWCLLVLMEIKMHRRWWKGILWLRKAHQERTLTHLFQYHNICISLAKCFLLAVFHVILCYSLFLVFRFILKPGFRVSERTENSFEGFFIYLVWMKISFVNNQIITSICLSQNYSKVYIEYSLKAIVACCINSRCCLSYNF